MPRDRKHFRGIVRRKENRRPACPNCRAHFGRTKPRSEIESMAWFYVTLPSPKFRPRSCGLRVARLAAVASGWRERRRRDAGVAAPPLSLPQGRRLIGTAHPRKLFLAKQFPAKTATKSMPSVPNPRSDEGCGGRAVFLLLPACAEKVGMKGALRTVRTRGVQPG